MMEEPATVEREMAADGVAMVVHSIALPLHRPGLGRRRHGGGVVE